MVSSTAGWSIGIIVFILLVSIAYVLVLFECYKNKTFIFAPYTAPPPPANTFYPLGEIIPLTQEQIDQRNTIIRNSIGQT